MKKLIVTHLFELDTKVYLMCEITIMPKMCKCFFKNTTISLIPVKKLK